MDMPRHTKTRLPVPHLLALLLLLQKREMLRVVLIQAALTTPIVTVEIEMMVVGGGGGITSVGGEGGGGGAVASGGGGTGAAGSGGTPERRPRQAPMNRSTCRVRATRVSRWPTSNAAHYRTSVSLQLRYGAAERIRPALPQD